jgi:hypothetical protein
VSNVGAESGQTVTTRTTDSDKKYVTTLQIKNTVNLGDVDDGFFEKYDIHLLNLGKVVIQFKFTLQMFS